MLVQQAEEQKLRWDSEKDGWARMAEALIAQKAKYRDAADKDEVSPLLSLQCFVEQEWILASVNHSCANH